MFTKTLQLCLILTVCIVSMKSISITSIVRFEKCTYRKINPNQGCMGTFILPNVVLTTSYCAENCQAVGKAPIIRYYVHNYYKNYVHTNSIMTRNNIALALIEPKGRRTKLIKLSALDTTSTIGQKALIPVMDQKPRLAITIIEGCHKSLPFGYYVCATNKVTKKSIKVCQERQDQGLPLLIQDRIFGITGISDKCNLPQRSFTAIGPALYWIGTTVKELGYKNSVLTTLHDKYSDTNRRRTIAWSQSNNETETKSKTETATSSNTKSTISISNQTEKAYVRVRKEAANKVLENMPSFKKWFFSNAAKSNAYAPLTSSREPITNTLKTLQINDSFRVALPILREHSIIKSTTTTEDPYAAITFIPSPTTKRPTKLTSKSTTKEKITTKFTIPFVKLNEQNKTTNVMDWFNVMVKEKLKNSPTMYYVVSSTTATTRRPAIFIDLT